MNKLTLRIETLEEFARFSEQERRSASDAIARAVVSLPELESAPGPLMLFLSMEDELDTDHLVRRALDAGCEVYAPRTLRRERRMVPTRVTSLDEVRTGAYGIREPSGDQEIEPERLGFVVVPAVAFDRAGNRLGRGGGFYDRFLERLSDRAVTCGIIHSRHLLDQVPIEPHDRGVQIVVTEREILRVRAPRVG